MIFDPDFSLLSLSSLISPYSAKKGIGIISNIWNQLFVPSVILHVRFSPMFNDQIQ